MVEVIQKQQYGPLTYLISTSKLILNTEHNITNIQVAVGILKDSDAKYLLGKRLNSQSWPGWWEFPGGKLEKNEKPAEALKREIFEELGIVVKKYKQWTTRRVIENNKITTLFFFLVLSWSGKIGGKEGQELKWVNLKSFNSKKILPPNQIIHKALKNDLGDIYAITNLQEMQSENFFQILKNKIDQDLKFLQIREKALSERDLITFIKQIKRLLKRTNVKIIINGSIDLAYKYELDGVHLNSIQLYELENFPNDLLVGVSCHSKKDLEVAEEKNADYVVLGPVKKTLSHPNGDFIGWNKFKNLAEKSNLPVYAIGGMKKNDIALSFENGAIGIASQRDFWIF